MAQLSICLLGSFEARLDGTLITGFESNKVRALLAILACEPRIHMRESLAELLWPGWPQQPAMSNLRYALADLRKTIGDREAQPPYLLISRESLQLNLDGAVWVDTFAFCEAIAQAEMGAEEGWEKAAGLYRRSFLEGIVLPENIDFMEWIERKRAYFQEQALRTLRQVVGQFEQRREYERSLRFARREMEIEPCWEEGHQQVMRLLALSGQRSAALAQYDECRRLLEKELGVVPSRETVLLYEQIRDEAFPANSRPLSAATQVEPKEIRHPNNLPTQFTSFVGREKEITEIGQLLGSSRLVTLIGPGGVGKTGLALQVCADAQDRFTSGVWLVELAPLAGPGFVPRAVIQALGHRPPPDRHAAEYLCNFLSNKKLLLVLDNCELLIDAISSLAESLLSACPYLQILATSREPLRVPGEVHYHVPSLSLPSETCETQAFLQAIEVSDSVQLFVERALSVQPAFRLTAAEIPAVVRICRQLDGIPLAIELVAAWVRLFSVQQIASRLGDANRLQTGDSQTVSPRQQTLRAAIDWSYTLLSEEEQTLLRALSVFSVGWDLEAAEGVCADTLSGAQFDMLEGLTKLVDKSLVETSRGAMPRYHLLETIRHYAREKLVEYGEEDAARRAHLQYYLDLAERIEPELQGHNQVARMNQLEVELDNLRAALDWGLNNNLEAELSLATALGIFFSKRGREREGADWLDQGLALAGGANLPLKVRARALACSGYHHKMMIEYDFAKKILEESLMIGRELGPSGKVEVSLALNTLGSVINQRDPLLAVGYFREALELAREVGDPGLIAYSSYSLSDDLWRVEQGNPESYQLMHKALELYLEIGNLENIGVVYYWLGLFALDELDFGQARAWFEKSLPIFRQVGDQDSNTAEKDRGQRHHLSMSWRVSSERRPR
jgi:predicted ATPase/DNA-binding SARP family transcriptional activator